MTMYYALQPTQELSSLFTDAFAELETACFRSDFQLLTKAPMQVTLPEDTQVQLPDFIWVKQAVPLFSTGLLDAVLSLRDTDNLFLKPVSVQYRGMRYAYCMALPSRINAYSRTRFGGALISGQRVGRYHMFRLIHPEEHRIFVTERMQQQMEAAHPDGIAFQLIQGGNLNGKNHKSD